MILRQYLVRGRVQGVGFRAFTAARAAQMGLTGWVRNLSDGRVEALAFGPSVEQDKLRSSLEAGPLLARVEEVVVQDIKMSKEVSFESFLVVSNGDQPWCV